MKFPFAPIKELNLDERLRGEFIHRVLYFVNDLDEDTGQEIERIIRRVNDEMKTGYPLETMKKKVLEFLDLGEISPHFKAKPGRVVKREQEFSDPRGNLFRMDRVIFEEDQVFVMDYKTGLDKGSEGEFISQLIKYIRILKEIYPDKQVEGMIAYVDLKEVRKVE
jgi:ATP-dependent exoDNAse (exonuclease V) beta subunit